MKKLVLPGIIILTVLVLIAGIIGVSTALFTNRYQAEIAAIKAKGEPLTPKDLLKPIPPSEDAAVVYDRIYRIRTAGNYKDDSRIIDKVFSIGNAPMDTATRQSLEKVLTRSQPLIDLTKEAVSKPHYRVVLDPSTGMVGFPQFSEQRNMCRLLRARSVLRAQTGDMAGAAEDITMQFRIAAQPRDGGMLISWLVQVAVAAIATRTVADAAHHGEFSETQARQIYDAIGAVDLERDFRQSWLGERVFFLSESDPSRVVGAVTATGPGSMHSPVAALSSPLGSVYAKTVLRGDQAAYLRFIANQLDGIGLSYREAKARGLMDKATAFPVYAVLSKTMAPMFASSSFRRFSTEEQFARMQVFLALQAYKARYGGYPASMRELKSQLGWKLPKDPFSEKDFVYKRQAKGFVLYSVGPDMKDDGGRSLGDHVELDSKGDIVLRWDK